MARQVTTKQADSNVAPTDSRSTPPDVTAHAARRSVLYAGSIAGVTGGVAMAAYLVFASVAQGMEPFSALEPMGATFRGADALDGGTASLLFGIFLHLSVSTLVGLLFAAVLPGDFTPGNAAFICVGLAFVVMAFMTSLVVPEVNPVLKDRFHEFGGSWVIAHTMFGVTAGYVCQRLRQGLAIRAEGHLRQRTV